jgi:hypothetical protein
MRLPSSLYALSCLLFATAMNGQGQVRTITEPAGKTFDKALKSSLLIQPGAKPFHVKLEIAQTKTPSAEYAATIEETWVSPTQWIRTVSAKGLTETTVVNGTGTHYLASGDYFPHWLRSFLTALITEVPNPDQWRSSTQQLTHIELPNGNHSDPCLHAQFMLGTPPVQQVNFSNVCFKDGLLNFFGAPDYAMEFHDTKNFGKLKVARTLVDYPARGLELVGKISVLEEVPSPPASFDTPAGATDVDPFTLVQVSTQQLHDLAGEAINPHWPTPIPGQGMFTVWVSLDKSGTVREVHTLNTDESGFAGDMAATLQGLHWKAPMVNGAPVQIEGPLVFAYPPPAAK